MKKDFIQKLSIAMASALVITSVAPAATAEAATMGMNKTSKILYLNADNSTDTGSSYDFNITNKGKDYKKKYTFKWSVSKDGIVDLNTKNGKVEAVGVGKTNVTCKVYKKSNKKLYKTIKATVEVKANAETVVVSNQPTDGKMLVGTTFDFNRTMKNAEGGKATDKTEWKLYADEKLTEESKIATVDSQGVVTAKEAGTFYVVARTYQSKATKDITTATSEAVKVTVPVTMTDIKLTTSNKVQLTFDSSVKEIVKTAADVKVTTVATNKVNYPVKAVTVSEDGKTVTVESYALFTNGTTYAVTAADSTKEFTAQIGTISSISIANQVVAPITQLSDAKSLAYTVFDQYGVDVTENYSSDPLLSVVSSSTTASYVTSDKKLAMFNEGDVVSVQLVYTKYNTTTGTVDTIKSNVATVTCSKATANTTSKWTINSTADYATIYNSINVGQNDKYLFVTMKDSYNNDVTSGFTFTSMDPSLLVVDMHTGKLTPIKAGTALVKVECGSYVTYLTITVNPKSEIKSVAQTASQVILSNKITRADKSTYQEEQTVVFTLKDQYDADYKAREDVKITPISTTEAFTVKANDTVISTAVANAEQTARTNEEGKLEFVVKAVADKTGACTFRINVKGIDRFVTVETKTPGGAVSYSVTLDKKELDNAKKESTKLEVFGIDAAGTKVNSSVTGSTIKYEVKNEKGEVKRSGDYTEGGVVIKTEAYTVNKTNYEELQAGTYNVYVTNGPITLTTSFVVKSTKQAASYSQEKATLTYVGDGTLIKDSLAKCFTIKLGTTTISGNDLRWTFNALNAAAVSGDQIKWDKEEILPVYVEKVEFDKDGFTYSVNIGQPVTLKKNN
jgi:hypothetical protein